MIPSGTNSPPSAGIDPVIETLTTKRMVAPGTNSPPSAGIASVIETLTTKRWTISPRGYHPFSSQCFYH
jgi:hypothetical protein